MPIQCLISFGSNLGDRHAVMADAARLVADSGIVLESHSAAAGQPTCDAPLGLRTSRLYETPPIGGPGGQSPFLNAVAAFTTELAAAEVLDHLQRIEFELGRQRLARWGARTIDLDIVLHGRLAGPALKMGRRGLIGGRGPAGSSRALVLPHPRYTARRFVTHPACDVAADFCDPRFGWTLQELDDHLADSVPSMCLIGGEQAVREQLLHQLGESHDILVFDSAPAVDAAPNLPWVSGSMPELPLQGQTERMPLDGRTSNTSTDASAKTGTSSSRLPHALPRLIARMQRTTPDERWPAPHQIWPDSWSWPEYRLEVDDLAWAVGEIASAMDSMQCELDPVTTDGNWWR